jgi:HD-GYP domain-containing protein (c-di-GMP phosphodiesterase class II)
MTTDRVYRPALAREDALLELTTNAGTQFDPNVVDALERVIERWEPDVSYSADDIRAVLAEGAIGPQVGATI